MKEIWADWSTIEKKRRTSLSDSGCAKNKMEPPEAGQGKALPVLYDSSPATDSPLNSPKTTRLIHIPSEMKYDRWKKSAHATLT